MAIYNDLLIDYDSVSITYDDAPDSIIYDDIFVTYDSVFVSYDGRYPDSIPSEPNIIEFRKPHPNIDRSNWVYVPNFVRSRARYRGTRESYYINRMNYQLLYDLRKLDDKFDTLDTTLNNDLVAIETGGDIDATYVWNSSSAETFSFGGLNDLSLRLSRLKERVKMLEKR